MQSKPGRQDDYIRELERLYRYLVSQGFESDKVLQVLNRRKRPTS